MVDIIKQDMTDIWAVAGDVVAPDSAKVRGGWGVEAVPRQWWNWFENRQDTNIAYMLQKGIPEWDQFTEYLANKSYVQRNNIVYKCILTGTNKDPATTPANWIKAFPESSAYLEVIRPLAVANNSMAYIDNTGIAQNTPTTAFGRGILNAADALAARTLAGSQASNVNLTALSGVVASTNALPYFTGTSTMGTTVLTQAGRDVISGADIPTIRATLGLTSASTTALQSGQLDTTSGRILVVGAFGVGKWVQMASTIYSGSTPSDLYGLGTAFGIANGGPTGLAIPGLTGTQYGVLQVNAQFTDSTALSAISRVFITSAGRTFTQAAASASAWGTWVESWTTGNLVKTTGPLDTTSGRLTQVGDFGLGAQGDSPTVTDANNAVVNGFFKLGTPFTNGPTAASYTLTVTTYDTEVTQLAVLEGTSTPRMYMRKKSGVTWNAWFEYYGTNNTSSNVQSILSASTYAAIRSLLGLSNKAEAGANSDITSLSGLTTALSVSQGGTGTTTSTGTGSTVLSGSPALTGTPTAPTASLGNNSAQLATTAFVIANATATPSGTLIEFAGPVANAPVGYLLANGSAVSRTTYSALFAAIGTTWGVGDGSTTFNIPDARGQFLRGLDNGRGVDTSRTLGTTQASANLSHSHTGTTAAGGIHSHSATADSAGDHNHPVNIQSSDNTTGFNAFKTVANAQQLGSTGNAGAHVHNVTVANSVAHTHTFTTDASGGTESRPTNISVNIYIKY